MKYIGLIILIITLFHDIEAQRQTLTFRNYNTSDGLSQSSITDIIQDSEGFMWFATNDGLNRFDGIVFKHFKNNEDDSTSLSSNNIYSIFEDHKHNLWVGTAKGLNKYNRNKQNFERITNFKNYSNPLEHSITSIFEDTQNRFWIGTNKNIWLLDSTNNYFVNYFEDLFGEGIAVYNTEICEDKNGTLWFAFQDEKHGGVVRHDFYSGKTETLNTQHSVFKLKENRITNLFADEIGRIWIGYNNFGIDCLNYENKTIEHFAHEPDNENSINNNFITAIKQLHTSQIIIGTNDGFSTYDPATNRFHHYKNNDSEKSISDNNVQCIYISKENSLWIGTRTGGVSMADKRLFKFVHYHHEIENTNTINAKSVTCFAEDQNKKIWLATDGGGINYFDPNEKNFISHKANPTSTKSLTNNNVLALAIDRTNQLWAGMWQGGICRFEIVDKKLIFKKKYSPLETNDPNSNSVFKIFVGKNGDIWSGNFHKGLYKYNSANDNFEHINLTDSLGKSFQFIIVQNITEDDSGNLWLSTQGNGIIKYNTTTNQQTTYPPQPTRPNSLLADNIFQILIDSKNHMWLATNQEGLALFNPKTSTCKHFKIKDGLPSNTIVGMLEDQNGNLWLTTNNGISQAEIEINITDTIVKFHNYTISDGIQDKNFNVWAYHKATNGDFYFGGINGFNVFAPENISYNTTKPQIQFTDFLILNKSVCIGENEGCLPKHISQLKNIDLHHNDRVFGIRFAALNFINSMNNEYAFLMDGFDSEWNYIGNKREANYTNLDPGQYTFRVKASNNDGVWNEQGIAINITIHPPWWKTTWFKLLATLIIITTSWLMYRGRIRALKKQKHNLEIAVRQRTAELQEVNVELEEQQEEIMQQNEEIKAQNDTILDINKELKNQKEAISNAYLMVNQKNEEINNAYEIVKKQNTFINSSIRYAQAIQNAILPEEKILEQLFEYFIIYRPKDIVSGDFYWLADFPDSQGKKMTFIAAVDCTGHGVGGAFMSMIGNTLLNEIVKQRKVFEPQQILIELNQAIGVSMKRNNHEKEFGMDVCLCRIEKKDNSFNVTFAGAQRPLIYYSKQKKQFVTLKGVVMSIGLRKEIEPFTQIDIAMKKGDILYLTTDGYIDQPNNQRKRIGSKRLMDLLEKNIDSPMNLQKNTLELFLDNFSGEQSQRDDITVIGIKLK